MSVAGFDIGDQTSCIAVARRRGIDVLLNKESNRETPSVVAFGAKQRQMGTDGVGSLSVNPKNTVTQVKRLLGKPFSSPDVQRDIKNFPFEVVEGPDGKCLVKVDYLGERKAFTPEQLLAMIIVDLKGIAESDGSPVTDCVISVPTYFVESERYGMLNAAQIAGINCLRLINETTATALAYGIFKTDLPETDPVNVAFVDVGYASLQVSIVAFKKGQLRVLSHAWDRNLGGRDFDEVLFEHFVKEFDAKYKIDVKSNPRASFRLRTACEKLKKVLSANAEVPINVESLMDDKDVSGMMTRDKFEELAQPVIARVRAPLEKALAESKLTTDQIASVEIVGSSSRVPAVLNILREFFGKEPSRTMNAKECVSRGCALNCAMLSPIFRVRDFEVIDSFPFGVEFTWEKDGQPTTSTIFERNGPIPSTKLLTFFRNNTFDLTARYTDDSPVPEGLSREIGTFTIGPPQPPADGTDKAKLKVKVRLNLHGVVSVESVQQVEEEEYDEVVKKKVPNPAAPAKAQEDVKMEEAGERRPTEDEQMEDVPAAETTGGAGEPAAENGDAKGEEAAPMETEPAAGLKQEPEMVETTEVVKKKRTKKTDIGVQTATAGYNTKQLQDAFESECQMALQDRVQIETSERKNALETYVYRMRDRLSGALSGFVGETTREGLMKRLEAMEDWLYDEGEDETKSVYVAKLDELRGECEPIESRAREAETRPAAVNSLHTLASNYLAAAMGDEPKYAHLSQEERRQVADEAQRALAWLSDKQGQQAALRADEDPALLTQDIRKKEEVLIRVAQPILTKPPPKPEAPKPAEDAAKPAEGEGEGPKVEEPMEADATD